MLLRELREQAAQNAEEARAIKDVVDQEGRIMTAEEVEKYEGYCQKAEQLESEADRQERLETLEARLTATKAQQVPQQIADGSRIEVIKPFRFGQLRAFTGANAEADAYAAGKWLMATVMNDASARQWCRDHSNDRFGNLETRVQTEGINTAGGFVVPDIMERAVIDLRDTYGGARRNARVIPMSSDHSVIPRRTGGVTAYFVGETSEITASDKSWNQVELTAKKLAALTRVSTDLSEDAVINIADDLAQEMAWAFAKKEDECALDGTGASTYGGMVGLRVKMIDGNHAYSYVEQTAGDDEWAEIIATDLAKVMAALPKYARPGAKWHCSPACRSGCFDRLAMAAGGNTARDIGSGATPRYAGYPIEEWAAMISDDSSGMDAVIILFFGDYSMAATLGTRRGMTLRVSSDRYLEYDQIGIQATERFCIVNHDVGESATRGPVVGMLGNA